MTLTAKRALGIDIGGTRLSAAIVSDAGELLALERQPTPRQEGAEATLKLLETLVERLLSGPEGQGVIGLGIGFGGPVDWQNQEVRRSHHAGGWAGMQLGKTLSKQFNLPAILENDANAGGLGEYCFGAAQNAACLLYVNIGTGVGGAIVIDGHIWHGAHGNAGEFGHMLVDPEGPACPCGQSGCVEAMCSGDALGRMARETTLTGSSLAQFSLNELTGRKVGEAALAGDEAALGLVQRSARYMGMALASAANLLDPDIITLGGGVPELGKIYLEPVEMTFRNTAMAVPAKNVKILPAKLGYNAGVIGAAATVFTSL